MKDNNKRMDNVSEFQLSDDDMLLVMGGMKRGADAGMCPCGRAKAESNGYCKKCNSLRDMK